jgi:hypothetical protein
MEENFIKHDFANYKIEFFTNHEELADRINNLREHQPAKDQM